MDSRASSHMASNSDILSCVFSRNHSTPHSIIIGNGSLLPVTSTGHTYFPSIDHSIYLYDVLVSPDIIKNLSLSTALQLIILFLLNFTIMVSL
jgi:hypothetical protein